MSSRSSDSIFGLGVNKEDDLGWLSSADDLGLGGSGDVLRSDVLCPEFNVAETVFGDHVSIRGCSINDSTCTAQIRSKDSSWTSKTTDSYGGFTTEPAIIDSKNGFIPLEQVSSFFWFLFFFFFFFLCLHAFCNLSSCSSSL